MNDQSFQDTVLLLKCIYPYTKFVTRAVQQGTGYLNLPEAHVSLLSRDGLPLWSKFYEDPKRIKSLVIAGFLGSKNFKLLKEHFEDVGERNAQRYFKLLKRVLAREAASGEMAKAFENSLYISQAVYDRWYRRLSEDDKNTHHIDVYFYLYSFVVSSFNFASLMTFGVSICDLVARAKTGDDEAFFQAVQVDKTTLSGIPYFQQRLSRASISNDIVFFHKLAQRIEAPPIAGKIRHKRLMIVFSMLDDEGFLTKPISEIFDACETIGVYGQRSNQYDDQSLRKRLSEYLGRTGRQIRI